MGKRKEKQFVNTNSNGWELDESDSICIKWNNGNPDPDEVLKLMFCTCPKKCVRDTCPCVDNGLPCTACVKQECENYVFCDIESDYLSSDEENYLASPSLMFKFFFLQLTLLFCFVTS